MHREIDATTITAETINSPILDPLPTFDANHVMTRAEFTAQVIRARYTEVEIASCFWEIAPSRPPRFSLVFRDVHVDDRYAHELCMAMRNGFIRMNTNGEFKPDAPITFSEAATILSRAYALSPFADADTVSPWYYKHVQALSRIRAIPTNITRLNQVMTAGTVADMLDRVATGTTSKPSTTLEMLTALPAAPTQRTSSTTAPVTIAPSTPPTSQASVSTPTSTAQTSSKTSITSSTPAEQPASSSKRSFWELF